MQVEIKLPHTVPLYQPRLPQSKRLVPAQCSGDALPECPILQELASS